MASPFFQRLFAGGPLLGGTGGINGGASYPPAWSTPPFVPAGGPMPQMGGGGAVSAAPQPMIPTYGPKTPKWLQKVDSGFKRFTDKAAGVSYNPNLTPQENDAIAQQQRMAMMASLLQASAPRPKGTGSPLADMGVAMSAAQSAGSQFTNEALKAKLMQAQIAQMQQPQVDISALETSIRGSGLTPAQQDSLLALAKIDPQSAASEFAKHTLSPPKMTPGIGESPLGKLFADLDAAEQSGNTAAVQAIRAEIQNEIAPAEGKGPEITFDDVRGMRNDIRRDSNVFLQAQDAFNTLQSNAQQGTPAGDYALTYAFFRLQDPGSRVTESEFSSMGRAGSLPSRIQAAFNRTFTGQSLDADMRNDFLNTSKRQFETYRKQHERLLGDARNFATRHELQFEDVVPQDLLPANEDGATEYDYDPKTGQLKPR